MQTYDEKTTESLTYMTLHIRSWHSNNNNANVNKINLVIFGFKLKISVIANFSEINTIRCRGRMMQN